LGALLVTAIVFALYSLAGFVLAPHLVERWLNTTLASDAGQKLDIEGVALNPYTFVLSLTHVTLIRAQNPARVSVARVEARLDPKSLIERRWSFRDAVELSRVAVHSQADGRADFTAGALSATGVTLDPRQPSVAVGKLDIAGASLRIERHTGERLLSPPWLHHLVFGVQDPAAAIGDIVASAGRLSYLDATVRPPVAIDVDDVDARLSRDRNDNVTTIALSGNVAGSGSAELTARWQPPGLQQGSTVRLALSGLDLSAVSPYAARIIGQDVASGRADFDCSVDGHVPDVSVESRIEARDLRLAHPDEAASDTQSRLALALLEDPSGRVQAAHRDRFDRPGVAAGPASLCSQLWREYIAKLTASPFDVLADLSGWQQGRLDHLGFATGSAEVSPDASAQLVAIAGALRQRPLLGLTVQPGYDAAADRRALANRQLRLHITLATSARPPGGTEVLPLDVGNARVRDILDEFASTRLRAAQRRAIDARFADRDDSYYRAVFEALVDNEDVSEPALQRLARYRARAVTDALARHGIEPARLQVATEVESLNATDETLRLPMSVRPVAKEPGSGPD
jgi:outer membrane protein OmpA-like peptidoglycan-associated protein